MPKFDFTKTKVYTAAVAFAVILPTIAYFNIPVPKVAWSADVEKLEEYQLERFIDLYQREKSRQSYESLKLEREKEKVRKEEGEVPDSYLKEQEYLESDIKEIEDLLDQAQEQLLEIEKN